MTSVTSYSNLLQELWGLDREMNFYLEESRERPSVAGGMYTAELLDNIRVDMAIKKQQKRYEMTIMGNDLKHPAQLKISCENDVYAVMDLQKHHRWVGQVVLDDELDNAAKEQRRAKAIERGLNCA